MRCEDVAFVWAISATASLSIVGWGHWIAHQGPLVASEQASGRLIVGFALVRGILH
jgi:hypothetical protein